jgi:hypothetical protein
MGFLWVVSVMALLALLYALGVITNGDFNPTSSATKQRSESKIT